MKMLRCLTLTFFLMLAVAGPAFAGGKTVTVAPQYSSIAADLPLMPGLVEKPDTLVLFDKAEGRIAEITMTTIHSQIEILEFYAKTLPALGWRAENPQVWRRNGEQLTLRFDAAKTVTFYIEPQHSAGRAKTAPRNSTAPNW